MRGAYDFELLVQPDGEHFEQTSVRDSIDNSLIQQNGQIFLIAFYA